MSSEPTTYYCSNQLGRIILEGMEEIMGRGGVSAVLSMARLSSFRAQLQPNDLEFQIPYQTISRIQQTLEKKYGERSGQGLALRVGQATFRYSFREFADQAGMNQLSFRLLPPQQKIQQGAGKLAEMLSQLYAQNIRVEDQGDSLRWIVDHCPYCWHRHAESPVCHLGAGFLQEFLFWASGGHFYHVVETECIAMGAPACVYTIDKKHFA
jgi:predicted ArsR family transcriptional regulator